MMKSAYSFFFLIGILAASGVFAQTGNHGLSRPMEFDLASFLKRELPGTNFFEVVNEYAGQKSYENDSVICPDFGTCAERLVSDVLRDQGLSFVPIYPSIRRLSKELPLKVWFMSEPMFDMTGFVRSSSGQITPVSVRMQMQCLFFLGEGEMAFRCSLGVEPQVLRHQGVGLGWSSAKIAILDLFERKPLLLLPEVRI